MTRKRLTPVMTIATLLFASTAWAGEAAQAPIRSLLKHYEQRLNASDVAGILDLYTRDGVFMAPHHPSAVGTGAIRTAYEGVFRAIDLDIRFDIVEIGRLGDDWAFARTNSAGTVTINDSGVSMPEGNQELFLLHKTRDGQWKIARYSFSSTRPR